MIYGFSIMHKPNYHAICNFRSWTLLLSMFLGFSGSFASLGFGLDWTLFQKTCMDNVFSASVAASLSKLNTRSNTQEIMNGKDSLGGEITCKRTYDGLLCTTLILYVFMEVCIVILFFNINSFKSTRFEKEDKMSAIRRRKRLAERNKRLGVLPKEEGDQVEGINDQGLDVDEIEGMEKGKNRSVKFVNDLDESPNSVLDQSMPISSPSTDHERSTSVQGFLANQQNDTFQLLPHIHLPISSPFPVIRTPKGSSNEMEANLLSQPPQSAFSSMIPTPPAVCSPWQGEEEDMILTKEAFRFDTNNPRHPSTSFRNLSQQRNDKHSTPTPHPTISSSTKRSSIKLPKIVVESYGEDGNLHGEDVIKRAIKSFTSSKV